MTTWTQSQRVGLRPSPAEVWALRIAQRIEHAVEGRMQRRADRGAVVARREVALRYRSDAFATGLRGLHL